jgi:hypothetical protein
MLTSIIDVTTVSDIEADTKGNNAKQVNIYSLFVREYITRKSQVQKLQNSKLLAKIRKNFEM